MTIALRAKQRKLVLTARRDDIWVVERDQVMVEGETLKFAISVVDNTFSVANATKLYLNGNEYSTPLSGSDSYNGSVLILKTIEAQAGDAGKVYVVVASAMTNDGVKKWKFLIRVVEPESDVETSEIYDDVWVVERKQKGEEGAALAYSLNFIGASEVSSPVSKVYRNGTDISSTVQSGADSVSGTIVTLQVITLQTDHGGSIYVVEVEAVVDGNTEKRKFLIYVADPASEN